MRGRVWCYAQARFATHRSSRPCHPATAEALLRQLPEVRVVGSSMGDPSSNRWGPSSRCTTVTQFIEVVTFCIHWYDAQRIKISPFTDPSNNERALDLRNRNSPRLCPHSTRVRH